MRLRPCVIFAAAIATVLGAAPPPARADVPADFEIIQAQVEEVLLDSLGHRLDPQDWAALQQSEKTFAAGLQAAAARTLWTKATAPVREAEATQASRVAEFCGTLHAILEHVAALEMLDHQRRGDIAGAQAWRAVIALPKHANAVEGALALQRLGNNKLQLDAVSALLAREYVSWQATRVRERLDGLKRAAAASRANEELVAARIAEISTLANFPAELSALAHVPTTAAKGLPDSGKLLTLAAKSDWPAFLENFVEWQTRLESELPNLLTPEEIERHGRLLVKLVRLVPKEYHNGVRDGQIVVPLEYREAKDFIV